MAALAVKTFVTICPNYWGKATSLEGALKNMRQAGAPRAKQKTVVYAIDCDKEKVEVYAAVDVSVVWPKEHTAMRFEAKL